MLEELDFTLGNGPAADAHERGVPVLEAILTGRTGLPAEALIAELTDEGYHAEVPPVAFR